MIEMAVHLSAVHLAGCVSKILIGGMSSAELSMIGSEAQTCSEELFLYSPLRI